ncbi:MAG: MbcA/ParS/Xre antitoxin family protein [Actinomycetota bacterium]|nr:MbcA/ParS/Xre antitoxin family protein [Actinomycetota bacterium]
MMSALEDRDVTGFGPDAAELLPLVADLSRRLSTAKEAPFDFVAVLDKVADRLPTSPVQLELSGVDPYLAEALTYGVMRCYRALRRPPRQARPELRIGLEQIRQALAYILEEEPTSDIRPLDEIARWLTHTLDTRQADVAEVLGVSTRTLHRWCTGASSASGAEAARLRLVARLVSNLRHAMTPSGALLWLREPHPDLGGRAPAELLDDIGAYSMLVRLAARTRSHSAS